MPQTFNISDVMISYSRKDKKFVKALSDAITKTGRETWVDWEDIPPTANWWAEIKAGIEAAHTFVFVISPNSLRSEVCYDEIEYAVNQNKRIVPILFQSVDTPELQAIMHPALVLHNWISFQRTDNTKEAFRTLIKALETDLQHTSEHTRLLVKAREWENKNKPRSLLLRGDDLKDAQVWLRVSQNMKPVPTDLQIEYIAISKQVENLITRATITLAGVTLVVVMLLFLQAQGDSQRATQALRELEAASTVIGNVATQEYRATQVAEADIEIEKAQATQAYVETESFELSNNAQSTVIMAEELVTNAISAEETAVEGQALAEANQGTAVAQVQTAESSEFESLISKSTADSALATANIESTTANNLQQTADVAAVSAIDLANDAQTQAVDAENSALESEILANEAVLTADAGQLLADTAQSTANAGQLLAANAQQTVDGANVQAVNANATADLAQNQANIAATQAANAQSNANQAETLAANSQSQAIQAAQQVDELQSTASVAERLAENAQLQADEAATEAAVQENTANQAQTLAANALSQSNQAATEAANLENTAIAAEIQAGNSQLTAVAAAQEAEVIIAEAEIEAANAQATVDELVDANGTQSAIADNLVATVTQANELIVTVTVAFVTVEAEFEGTVTQAVVEAEQTAAAINSQLEEVTSELDDLQETVNTLCTACNILCAGIPACQSPLSMSVPDQSVVQEPVQTWSGENWYVTDELDYYGDGTSWRTNRGVGYATLTSQYPINLEMMRLPELSFVTYSQATNSTIKLEIRVNGAWQPIHEVIPTGATWMPVTIDLSPYYGTSTQIRFVWSSQAPDDVWFLDNLALIDVARQAVPIPAPNVTIIEQQVIEVQQSDVLPTITVTPFDVNVVTDEMTPTYTATIQLVDTITSSPSPTLTPIQVMLSPTVTLHPTQVIISITPSPMSTATNTAIPTNTIAPMLTDAITPSLTLIGSE